VRFILWLADAVAEPRQAKKTMLDRQAHDQGTIGMKRKTVGKASELCEVGDAPVSPGEKQLAAAIRRVGEAGAFSRKILPILRLGEDDLATVRENEIVRPPRRLARKANREIAAHAV
jgi:hypothetical protein